MAFNSNPYSYSGVAADTCMDNLEDNDNELRCHESGSSAPSSPANGMIWNHSTKGLHHRSNSSTWQKVLTGTANFKIWVYRNTADEGWVVSSSVTNRVLALRGTNYGSTGGTTYAGGGGSHVHQIYKNGGYNAADSMYNSSGSETALTNSAMYETKDNNPVSARFIRLGTVTTGDVTGLDNAYTKARTITSAYRPAAAVGTLQYPDIAT
jgi:hypothetical protein